MFLMIGVDQKQRQLDYDQVDICPVCKKYGHVHVMERYTCLSLFFIPTIRWGKEYCVHMSCCGSAAPLSEEAGKLVVQGRADQLRLDRLKFYRPGSRPAGGEQCPHCGTLVAPGYRFCPYCGERI